MPPHVNVLSQADQLKYITTMLRNKETLRYVQVCHVGVIGALSYSRRDDFIFYSDRVSRLVVEEALNLLPSTPKTVHTPTDIEYMGVSFNAPVLLHMPSPLLFSHLTRFAVCQS